MSRQMRHCALTPDEMKRTYSNGYLEGELEKLRNEIRQTRGGRSTDVDSETISQMQEEINLLRAEVNGLKLLFINHIESHKDQSRS